MSLISHRTYRFSRCICTYIFIPVIYIPHINSCSWQHSFTQKCKCIKTYQPRMFDMEKSKHKFHTSFLQHTNHQNDRRENILQMFFYYKESIVIGVMTIMVHCRNLCTLFRIEKKTKWCRAGKIFLTMEVAETPPYT